MAGQEVTLFSAFSPDGTTWSLPLRERDLAAFYHLKDIFLVKVETNSVILPTPATAANAAAPAVALTPAAVIIVPTRASSGSHGADADTSLVFEIPEGEEHLIVMGTPLPREPSEDKDDEEYEVVPAGMEDKEEDRGTQQQWEWGKLGQLWASSGGAYVSESLTTMVRAVCATVRNPFTGAYSSREILQIRLIHRLYFTHILHIQHHQHQHRHDGQSSLSHTPTTSSPPSSSSPSSRELPLWLRVSQDYLRPFTATSQRNFSLDRWRPSVSPGPLSSFIVDSLALLCAYQTERAGRATGAGSLDDPVNLCLEELKEWLITLSRVLPTRPTLSQLGDRIAYLEELGSSGLHTLTHICLPII